MMMMMMTTIIDDDDKMIILFLVHCRRFYSKLKSMHQCFAAHYAVTLLFIIPFLSCETNMTEENHRKKLTIT